MFQISEAKALLKSRWDSLPQYLQTDNQVVGRHWVQCGFTMGPSYCSFGCSHCYLPGGANKVPIIPIEEMKQQIDANRKLIGKGGGIQITGGDVVDAYLGADRFDELVEVVGYAVSRGLVPMLMTHGQGLLNNPSLLYQLVKVAGLRKLSCHIDLTQAGRRGFPIKSLKNEKQLNPIRDQLVDLVLSIRKQTGCHLTAAQTVTVTPGNIESIDEILIWLMSRPQNMDVTRTISFQTVAEVGRSKLQSRRVYPEDVWKSVSDAMGKDLPRNHLLFGHPDCSTTATVLVRSADRHFGRKIVNLSPGDVVSQKFWQSLLKHSSKLGSPCEPRALKFFRNTILIGCQPLLIWRFFLYLKLLIYSEGLRMTMMFSALTGKAKGFNIVMHNFIDAKEVIAPTSQVTKDRLSACSFRGAVQQDGKWISMPMCEVNANIRPNQYQQLRSTVKTNIS